MLTDQIRNVRSRDLHACLAPAVSRENQADIIEAFNSTSKYLDDLFNIDNIYFD